MPPIWLDHIAIALPRIADAPPVVVAVPGGQRTDRLGIRLAQRSA